MIERYFIPIIAILTVGYSLSLVVTQYTNNEVNLLERVVISIVLGYASLIIPMVVTGLVLTGKLNYVVFLYYSLSILVFLILCIKIAYKIHRYSLPKLHKNKISIFTILIVFLLLFYLFISLLYKERGWDALQFYFPNALYFVLSNDIPAGINPFSLYPTFAPPLTPLLITYSIYVTKGNQTEAYANLHPWIFLLGTAIIIFLLISRMSSEKHSPSVGVLFFLLTPLTYFLIYEYAYYQELPVMFFYSATIYFISKVENKDIVYSFLASTSATLAILSKLSGYSILLLIPIIFSIDKVGKPFRYALVFVMTLLLSYKTASDTYIGSGIVVILLGIYLIQLIRQQSSSSPISLINIFVIYSIPIIFGMLWINFMLQIPNIDRYLVNTFIAPRSEGIKYTFSAIGNPYLVYLENGMAVSFISSISYILTGSLLGLTWVLFKLLGMIYVEEIDDIKIWIISFFMIWLGYFGTVSVRYLSVILPGLAIIVAVGYTKFLSFFNKAEINIPLSEKYQVTTIFIAFSGLLFVYPFNPIRYLLAQVNTRLYLYHQNQILLWIYIILWIFTTIFVLERIDKRLLPSKRKVVSRIFSSVLIILIISPQISLYAINDFDRDEFNENATYFHRQEYMNLIEAIKNEDIDFEEKIVSVNTPGLHYYVTRTVVDLKLIQTFDTFEQVIGSNESETFNLLVEHEIVLVITLESSHVYYEVFKENFEQLILFQIIEDENNFENIFENSEFSIFRRIHSNSYVN